MGRTRSIYVPSALDAIIELYIKKTGKSFNQVVREALVEYLKKHM